MTELSHAAKTTIEYLFENIFGKHRKIIQGPACYPNFNPLENVWSILKRKIYFVGKQYTVKDDLWNAVLTASDEVTSDEIRNFTSSMNQRILVLINKKGNYIQY